VGPVGKLTINHTSSRQRYGVNGYV